MRIIAACELVVQKGTKVPAGETVDLPADVAGRLLKRGLARRAKDPGPVHVVEGGAAEPSSDDAQAGGPDDDAIMAAMLELDEADKSLWTRDGRPKTEAVEAVLGQSITAEQRDRIWAEIQAD